jgi:CRP-like cAMP-binding protein
MTTTDTSFLESLTVHESVALEPHLSHRSFSVGESLFSSWPSEDCIIFIRRGCAKVVTCTGLGRDVMTDLLIDGAVYGLLDGRPQEVSAVCVAEVTALMVPRSVFFTIAASVPTILVKAISACCARFREHRETIVGLALESAGARACRALARLGDRVGRRTLRGTEIPFCLTRQEFSELIGSTPETATRELSRLRKSGLFYELEDKTVLPDLEELRGRSDLLQVDDIMNRPELYAAS